MVYDCIIIGSGYASFGYALSHKNTLIIDSGELCDKFFCGCGNMGKGWDAKPSSELGKKLMNTFEEYGVIKGSFADIAALETVFCKFLSDYSPSVMFLTETAKTEKIGELYYITVYSNEGYSRLCAKNVIIAVPQGKSSYVSARFRGACADEIKKVFPTALLYNTIYENEIIAHIPPQHKSLAEERERIINDWWEKSEQGILMNIFPLFGYDKGQTKNEDGIMYLDEQSFDNALAAFEFGGAVK